MEVVTYKVKQRIVISPLDLDAPVKDRFHTYDAGAYFVIQRDVDTESMPGSVVFRYPNLDTQFVVRYEDFHRLKRIKNAQS